MFAVNALLISAENIFVTCIRYSSYPTGATSWILVGDDELRALTATVSATVGLVELTLGYLTCLIVTYCLRGGRNGPI